MSYVIANIIMIDKQFTITGTQVKTEIELALLEIESEIEAFINRANVEIKKLQNEGQSEKQASAIVRGQILGHEDFAKTFFHTVDKVIQEIGKQTVARPVREFAKKDSGQLYDWELGSVKSVHCPDCLRVSRLDSKTVSGWLKEGVGLPREGLTICNVGCRCMLRPKPL